ncbi:MAG: substrate-binding domain-containing protein [Verrucomicrobia bacterium]|nr:substrate-binding domain-containing protein [Verrucomicrobiota bacterium]
MGAKSSPRPPLYQRTAFRLRGFIAKHGEPGQQLDSETELAVRFGVSMRTIREALGVLAHEGLIERKHGRGTFVGRRRQQHVALWCATDSRCSQGSQWSFRVLERTEAHLRQENVSAKIYWTYVRHEDDDTGSGAQQMISDLSQNLISAVGVMQGPFVSSAQKLAQKNRVPVVGGILSPDASELSVGCDRAGVARRGAQYLLEQGCRRIALLGWFDSPNPPPQLGGHLGEWAWYAAFRSTLEQSGVPVRERWIRGDLHPTWTGAGYEEFREVWSAETEKPDGLFVIDDVLFQDVVAAILEMGIAVPSQLKVVATANKRMVTCPFFPAARIELDPDEQAAATGRMLAKLAKGESLAERQVMIPFGWAPAPTKTEDAGRRTECKYVEAIS